MKISTRGRYALRIMLDLALSDSGRPVRVKEIAERQEISEKYMEQIISVLNKAGYVRSIRGPQGGYFLTRKPVDCLEYEGQGCQRKEGCATLLLWERLDQAVRGVIDTVTLKDLAEWSRGQTRPL